MNRISSLVFAWLALAVCGMQPPPARALDNSDCFVCHEDKDLSKKDADGKTVSLFVDPAQYAKSMHGSNACQSCHIDITEAPHPDGFKAKPVTCAHCHAKASSSYEGSTHGIAHLAGKPGTPDCSDCHGKHSIAHLGAPTSPLHHENLGATCGKCHSQVLKEVQESVHGKAMAQGIREAPQCTDCHSDHKIEGLRTASPMKIAEQVCSRCHASERMNSKYSLPADRVKTFFESYHGMAARLGSSRAANCASCHGYHSILPSSDPRSMVNKANMVTTCRKCHPEANENFVAGKVHFEETGGTDLGGQISGWVRRVYLALIVLVIGGMLAHNALVFWKKILLARKNKEKTVVRMSGSLRVQHLLLLTSFIALSVTGFALKFPDSALAWLVGSNETVRRVGHRFSAIVMLALAVYHAIFCLATREGRKLVKDFLPTWKDFLDFFGNALYLLGVKSERPKFARFGYPEKAEYWAVVWGTGIMGLTGLIIWFKMGATEWMPRWVIDVATTIHYYEAVLAVLAIIVWHFYHVFFDPDIYPVNTAWLDGRVPEEWYREEHGLDHETLGSHEHGEPHKADRPENGEKS